MTPLTDAVTSDVRNTADAATSAWLRSPEMLEAWRRELITLYDQVIIQLTRKKRDALARDTEYQHALAKLNTDYREAQLRAAESKAGALGFLKLITDRIHEVKGLQHQQIDPVAEVGRLRAAIENHRRGIAEADPETDTTGMDEALWKALG